MRPLAADGEIEPKTSSCRSSQGADDDDEARQRRRRPAASPMRRERAADARGPQPNASANGHTQEHAIVPGQERQPDDDAAERRTRVGRPAGRGRTATARGRRAA